jgi:hypothetical protein
MPDSFSSEDLKRLRALYPEPPYRRYPYQYTYFGMGQMGTDPVTVKGVVKSDTNDVMNNRLLVQSRERPVMRLRRHENVSSKEPYSFYDDPEVKRDIPDDGWPFVSYYYLMGMDGNGRPIVTNGPKQDAVNMRASKVRGSDYVSPRQLQLPNRPTQMLRPTGSVSFLSLENF